MEIIRRLSKKDWLLITLAMVVVIVALFLYNDSDTSGLESTSQGADKSLIGEVNTVEKDVRKKQGSEIGWNRTRSQSKILDGDALFAGEKSSAHIKMVDGQEIDLGENSLIHFGGKDGQKIGNLAKGNFRLKVDGKLKVKIRGRVTTLEGNGSDVQIYLGQDAKPKIKLLSGELKLAVEKQDPNKSDSTEVVRDQVVSGAATPAAEANQAPELETVSLKPNEVTILNLSDRPSDGSEVASVPIRDPSSAPLLGASAEALRDTEIPAPPPLATTSPPSAVDQQGVVESAVTKLTNFFAAPVEEVKLPVQPAQSPMPPPTVEEARSGVASESKAEEIEVPIAPPTLRVSKVSDTAHWMVDDFFEYDHPTAKRKQIRPSELKRKLALNWCNSVYKDKENYTVRVNSKNVDMTLKTRHCKIELSQISIGINKLQIFTETGLASPPVLIEIDAPTFVDLKPEIAESNVEAILRGESAEAILHWKKTGSVKAFIVDLSESPNFPEDQTKSFYVYRNEFKSIFSHVATNYVRVATVTDDNLLSHFSNVSVIQVLPEQMREPSSVDVPLSTEETQRVLGVANNRAVNSFFALQAISRAVYSSEQLGHGQTSPIFGAAAIQNLSWFKSTGLEFNFENSLAPVNASAAGVSITDVDLRLHQRAFFNQTALNFIRLIQISGFVGAEAYRSSGSSYYSKAYNILLAGLTLNFLINHQWTTGGEVYVGHGLDSSEKLGFSGNIQYYFDRQFSLGVGYKAFFFKTTSRDAEPAEGSYREGVGEAYSMIRYQY